MEGDRPQPSLMTIEVLVGVLLVCLGLLLGTSWTIQASQPKLRRQAMERHRLNEEWSTVCTARLQWEKCHAAGVYCPTRTGATDRRS